MRFVQVYDSKNISSVFHDFLSKYDYFSPGNIVGSLAFYIHSWTESEVDVFSFHLGTDGMYSGTLEFTFKDNFGLDNEDVEKFGIVHKDFKSWFILQHYDKYNDKYDTKIRRPF